MNKLKDKILKNTTIEFTASLLESKIYAKKDMISTKVPMINVALSGTIDGGIAPGMTMIAGQSRHFKTGFSLVLASAFLDKYPEGIVLFYDSEFGTTHNYFKKFNVVMESVVHTPITDIEMLKFDLVRQLTELNRDDHVLIIIDSIGNLASKKEVEDTLNQKAVADMTRAKQLKSLFRMVTPYLTLKDIPLIVVNHTYKEMALHPRDIVGGGTGGFYSSDNIWIVGRQQDKNKEDEIQGYHFIINVEKSRYVKEKSKIPITVSYDAGVHKWSGLFDVALESGHIIKSGAWYKLVNAEEGAVSFRRADIENNDEFWAKMFAETDFPKWIEERYKLG